MRRWLIEWSIRALIIAVGESGTVEGTVREINKTHHTVYLANGTMLWTNDMKLLDQLAPGARVRAAFEDRGPLMTGWERYFRLDWSTATHQGRPVVYGHVRNEWGVAAVNVRLLVEGLDEQGQIANQTIGWLGTLLTPGTTAAFEVPVNARAPRYRVSVFAFDWVQRGRGPN
jgi:hypothetical protein